MMKKMLTAALISWSCFIAQAQNIGLGTSSPDPSAALDMTSNSKGLLIPRMNTASMLSIASPAKGLLVYDSLKNQLMVNMGTAARPDWQNIVSGSGWGLTGNTATDTTVNFIGTTDNQPLLFRVNNQSSGMIDSITANTYLGYASGRKSSGGLSNTAFGYKSMEQNATGSYNTAFGVQTLSVNANGGSIGSKNTAIGHQALMNNLGTTGNTAVGYQALFDNSSNLNTAVGYQAMYHGGQGASTAVGAEALYSGGGNSNTAIGVRALYACAATASYNTVSGFEAMISNYSGSFNTGSGYQVMHDNYSGQYNTAYGSSSLYANTYGNQNTSIGYNSLSKTIGSDGNTAIGYNAGASYNNGYYNCFIGSETDANGPGYYNTIALGHGTIVTAPNMMRVGNGSTASIGGPVGWSTISDGRVKKNIQENIPGLAFINRLRPVSYNIDAAAIDRIVQPPIKTNVARREINTSEQMQSSYQEKEKIVYTGFVAQEVEQSAKAMNYAFSGVDAPRNDKDLYGLRYSDFVVPLVKAVQELSASNDQLTKDNELLRNQQKTAQQRIAALKKQLH
ncbi:MAG TPA: tail fiber domain-containing protein [Puia sp.]|nr:tail fiber domain-containing protein [Puia sp.]